MLNDCIIVEKAQQLLTYDADTGYLYWKHDMCNRRIKAGTRAGSRTTTGYMEIRFGRKPVMQHRVAWFLYHGFLPECQLDHINRDKADNRISNLRMAPENAHHNNQNRNIGKNNTSGAIGVMWNPVTYNWLVRIKVKGHSIYVGSFKCFDDAVAARKAAELRYFTFANS